MVRQHETQWTNDVGRDLPEDFTLDQRLAHQPEIVIFEVTQATMHELGRPRRGAAGQIVHLAQENRISAADRVARDTAAVDAPADDSEVEGSVQRRFPSIRLT